MVWFDVSASGEGSMTHCITQMKCCANTYIRVGTRPWFLLYQATSNDIPISKYLLQPFSILHIVSPSKQLIYTHSSHQTTISHTRSPHQTTIQYSLFSPNNHPPTNQPTHTPTMSSQPSTTNTTSSTTTPRPSTDSAPPAYSSSEKFYGSSNTSKKSLLSIFSHKKSSESKTPKPKKPTTQPENKEAFYAAAVFHAANR